MERTVNEKEQKVGKHPPPQRQENGDRNKARRHCDFQEDGKIKPFADELHDDDLREHGIEDDGDDDRVEQNVEIVKQIRGSKEEPRAQRDRNKVDKEHRLFLSVNFEVIVCEKVHLGRKDDDRYEDGKILQTDRIGGDPFFHDIAAREEHHERKAHEKRDGFSDIAVHFGQFFAIEPLQRREQDDADCGDKRQKDAYNVIEVIKWK